MPLIGSEQDPQLDSSDTMADAADAQPATPPTSGSAPPHTADPDARGGMLHNTTITTAGRKNTPDQAAYESALVTLMQILYDKGAIATVVHACVGQDNIGQHIGDQAMHLLRASDHHAQARGGLPASALITLGTDCIALICQAITAAGTQLQGSDIATAVQTLIVEYMKLSGATQSQIQQMLARVDADKLGEKLDEMMEKAGAGGGQPGATPPQGGDDGSSDPDAGGGADTGGAPSDDETAGPGPGDADATSGTNSGGADDED
jgi:hypothetical protein